MATASTPSLWARSMQVETTFLCPLCMPSKLPMVTTLASLPGMSEREYQTFIVSLSQKTRTVRRRVPSMRSKPRTSPDGDTAAMGGVSSSGAACGA